MNNQQLSNTTPPVIDFLAIEESQPTPPFVEGARQRFEAFVEGARQRLVGLPYAVRLHSVRVLLRELRRQKPNPSSIHTWWSDMDRHPQAYWRIDGPGHDLLEGRVDGLESQAQIKSEGFIPTGMATIKGIRLEGFDAPDAPANDGFTHYEHRLAKDNRLIGTAEEEEVSK